MRYFLGFDIGGTKCAASLGQYDGDRLIIRGKSMIDTMEYQTPIAALQQLAKLAKQLSEGHAVEGIGISSGGPLDSEKGLLLSPPNLIGWDRVPITEYFSSQFGVPATLQNDANAGAIAEWKFGAGQGYQDLVFLTFGTGIGAGLILNGQLYKGCSDTAGEVGHIRMETYGPVGYGKSGSFEGFCSGGGIVQLAQSRLTELTQSGKHHPLKKENPLTAKAVFDRAKQGDPLCMEICKDVGHIFGRGLSILIDLLNPQAIIAGSIFSRNFDLLYPILCETLSKEALSVARKQCKILPSALGDSIGDMSALAVALYHQPDKSNAASGARPS